MLAVSMPNFATSSALVETATKCLAMAPRSPLQPGQQPVARGVGVGHGLQRGEGLRGDDEQRLRGIEIAHRLGEIGAVDVGDEAERHGPLAVVLQRLIGHDGPKVGAADADIDHIADPLAGMALPVAAAHAVGEVGHLVQHGMDIGHHIPAVDGGSRRRAARAARHEERRGFSETLIFSPRNMASMRSRRPDSSASCSSSSQGFVGDPVLRIVEIDPGRFERQPLAAVAILGKKLPQVELLIFW